MNQELAVTFRKQILKKHEEGVKLDDELRDVVLRKLNVAREVGILLQESRDSLGFGGYSELRKDLGISDAALAEYISFSKRHAEPITDFREALRNVKAACQASGLLEIAPGHAKQNLHEPHFFSTAAATLNRFLVLFRKHADQHPITTWRPAAREQFRRTLEPMVKIYHSL